MIRAIIRSLSSRPPGAPESTLWETDLNTNGVHGQSVIQYLSVKSSDSKTKNIQTATGLGHGYVITPIKISATVKLSRR